MTRRAITTWDRDLADARSDPERADAAIERQRHRYERGRIDLVEFERRVGLLLDLGGSQTRAYVDRAS